MFDFEKAYFVKAFLDTARPDAQTHLKMVDAARERAAKHASYPNAPARVFTMKDGAHPGAQAFRHS